MDKDKVKVKQLMDRLAYKYKISAKEIEEIVNSPYHFTYEKLKELKLDEVESEDEAKSLKTNFNYKAFGKLYFSWDALQNRRKRRDNALKINRNVRRD